MLGPKALASPTESHSASPTVSQGKEQRGEGRRTPPDLAGYPQGRNRPMSFTTSLSAPQQQVTQVSRIKACEPVSSRGPSQGQSPRTESCAPTTRCQAVDSKTREVSGQQQLDEALLDVIVLDCQPLSVVDNNGFNAFIKLLEPRQLNVHHITCFAHVLNLIVKKSLAQTAELEEIRTRARRPVGYFKSSTTAKEKLCEVQEQMGKPKHKLIREVDTRWNSTFSVLQRLYEPQQPLAASLPSLNTDLMVFSSEEFEPINPCVQVLWPIRQATVEMCEEKSVSGSKVIPLVKMLKQHSARQVPQESVPPVPPPDIQDRNLWGLLDSHVEAEQPAPSATSSAIAEVPKRCTPVKGGGPPEALG
ncbi:hypothetical protein AOLI_G00080050 [Acnodon oligacanthus]